MSRSSVAFAGVVSSIQLPRDNGCPTGPLFSLAEDKSSNRYCSDEFNHSVLSFNSIGELRWKAGGKGSEPGRFRYPRGLALGWIRIHGDCVQCLAVADAWNHRVQFFNDDGEVIGAWSQFGEEPFDEVNDVRFILSPGIHGDGYWLVLDRGNHRLCALDCNGNCLTQIGRGAPDRYSELWNLGSIGALKRTLSSGTIPFFRPCDVTYYPTRIVGSEEETLFVSEQGLEKLKRIFHGNLFPISFQSAPQFWIGADAHGIAGAGQDYVRFYDFCGKLSNQIPVAGLVIPSNLPLNQVWIQSGNCLQKIHLERELEDRSLSTQAFFESPLRPNPGIGAALDRYVHSMQSLVDFTRELATLLEIPTSDIESVAGTQNKLEKLRLELQESQFDFCRLLHEWSIAAATRLLEAAKPGLKSNEIAGLDFVVDKLKDLFPKLLEASNLVYQLQSTESHAVSESGQIAQEQKKLVANLASDFREAVTRIYRLAFDFDDPNLVLQLLPDKQPSCFIAKPAEREMLSPRVICSQLSRPDRVVQESDGAVWFTDYQEKAIYRSVHGIAERLNTPELIHPQALLMAPDGLYVGDRAGGAVWRLHENRRPERRMIFSGEEVMSIAAQAAEGPIYVALYSPDRNSGRVIEFDREWNQIHSLESIDSRALEMPTDVAVCPDGNLVIVEWGNPGGVSVISNRGALIHRLSQPIPLPLPHSRALCATVREDGMIFVSDHWFGRIWRFAQDFKFLGALGHATLHTPAGLCANGSNLLVSDALAGKIWEFKLASL